jgi:hypothetical protein
MAVSAVSFHQNKSCVLGRRECYTIPKPRQLSLLGPTMFQISICKVDVGAIKLKSAPEAQTSQDLQSAVPILAIVLLGIAVLGTAVC